MERVRTEMCRADIDLGQLDTACVRHYRDLIRGGGTLAPIHLSADHVIMEGRHRIIGLAAKGAATVAAVRVDRAMRRKPTLARHGFGRLARPAASWSIPAAVTVRWPYYGLALPLVCGFLVLVREWSMSWPQGSYSCRSGCICERFHKTVLNEFSRVAFRKKVYRSIAASSGTLALRQNPDAELPGCHPDDEGKMLVPRRV
jgi:hypothetical protein